MEKLGTFVHGIGSTMSLDSSGERLRTAGIDDSSMEKDGFLNWEHNSEQTSQIVGKVLISKKILEESDCSNEHQLKFYNKIGKKPYLYICGVLFDSFGHTGAIDLAAMYKFNEVVTSEDLKSTVGFSIEGSKLDKEGDTITRCIARKMTCTMTPCNKECVSEMVTDEEFIKALTEKHTKDKLQDIFLKCEEMEMDLQKADDTKPKLSDVIPKIGEGVNTKPKAKASYTNIPKQTAMGTTGMGTKVIKPSAPIKVKGKTFNSKDPASSKMKVGDRVVHNRTASVGRSGASIYNDPDTFKTMNKKYIKSIKVVEKAMTAGGGGGAPSTLTGGSALQKEKVLVKKSEKLLSRVSNDYWSGYGKKEELVEFISIKMPKLNKREVLAIAKTTVYKMQKERELLLEGLCD